MTRATAGTLLLLAIAVAAGIHFSIDRLNPPMNDFTDQWTGTAFVRATGNRHIYGEAGDRAVGAFSRDPRGGIDPKVTELYAGASPLSSIATPFLHAVVSLYPADDYLRAFRVYAGISVLLLAFACFMLSRWFGYPPWVALAFWIAIMALFEPHVSEAANANVNRIQLGLLAAAWWCLEGGRRGGRFLYGFLCGLLVVFKPNIVFAPAALVLSRAIRREWESLALEAAGGAVGALAGVSAGAAFFGSFRIWAEWGARVTRTASDVPGLDSLNISLHAIVRELHGSPLPLLSLAVGAGALFLLVRMSRAGLPEPGRRPDFGHDLRVGTCGLAVYLLCAPLVWVHYCMLALPMAMGVLSPPVMRAGGTPYRVAAAAAFLGLAMPPAVFVKLPPVVVGSCLWAGMAALFAIATHPSARPMNFPLALID
jgi:hypothetical protein